MLSGPVGGALTFPQNGGVRTYVAIGTEYDSAEIFPLLEGDQLCDKADEIKFDDCESAEGALVDD